MNDLNSIFASNNYNVDVNHVHWRNMDIPYGFDCYSFSEHEVKFFEPNIIKAKSFVTIPYSPSIRSIEAHEGHLYKGMSIPGYVRFTRKNEFYPKEQLEALTEAGRLNQSHLGNQVFCGIKIQIGIGIVTNFLQKGMQYRRPNKGKSLLVNGSWDGIVSGLTIHRDAPSSYDMAFGNFLGYDEEFPYLKFGPFLALESKLVMLTGSSRGIETSSFGTNIQREIWLIILSLIIILSLLASFRFHWHYEKEKVSKTKTDEVIIEKSSINIEINNPKIDENSLLFMIHNFFFIYFTMLLNKPCIEFDNLIWPKHNTSSYPSAKFKKLKVDEGFYKYPENKGLLEQYEKLVRKRKKRKYLPISIKVLSYLWSAACFIMASTYSGELLAVILLHADNNIDTIPQLIASKPPIEPVIRQDDFTHNLMLKSPDKNLITLHNMTKVIPRPEVYTRRFIEKVADRKQALIGDDELIETIYDIYHKQFPLYRSKINYLQYPISIMYRKDLNTTLEVPLRRGMVQMFEMGLIRRWYQAQKETYIQFYDSFEKRMYDQGGNMSNPTTYSERYKPLSMHHFGSFFRFMIIIILFAVLVLLLEIIHIRWKI